MAAERELGGLKAVGRVKVSASMRQLEWLVALEGGEESGEDGPGEEPEEAGRLEEFEKLGEQRRLKKASHEL